MLCSNRFALPKSAGRVVILKKILIENGYIENGNYYFYIKDHLGNNRVVVSQSGVSVQQTDYYPFGMPMSGSLGQDIQPYKYSGKEYDTMNGLNQYDFQARQYDPSIIRFTTIDPLAEKYYSWSPYVYCGNNPISRIDPTGMHYKYVWGENGTAGNYVDINSGQVVSWETVLDYIQSGGVDAFSTAIGPGKSNKHVLPYDLGVEWLTGKGPRNRTFVAGDAMTE